MPKILLFLYLFAALTPHQAMEALGQLPQLIQHFREHQQSDASISVVAFITQHYGSEFAQHQSEHNHKQLPGKSDHHHSLTCDAAKAFVTPLPAVFQSVDLYFESGRSNFAQTASPLPSAHLSSIWQPPRVG